MTTLRVPHETEPVAALWSAWPHHPDWGDALADARADLAALIAACADAGAPARLLVRAEEEVFVSVTLSYAYDGPIDSATSATRPPASQG